MKCSSSTMRRCTTMNNDEKFENAELCAHLSDQDSRLRTVMTEGLSASSGAHPLVIRTLENQVKIAEIRAQDMSTEMNELVVANNQLKEPSSTNASGSTMRDIPMCL